MLGHDRRHQTNPVGVAVVDKGILLLWSGVARVAHFHVEDFVDLVQVLCIISLDDLIGHEVVELLVVDETHKSLHLIGNRFVEEGVSLEIDTLETTGWFAHLDGFGLEIAVNAILHIELATAFLEELKQ